MQTQYNIQLLGQFPDWNSMRIPRISKSYTELSIKQILINVGIVNRVDFVAIPGQEASNYRTAFVHFDSWFNSYDTFDLRNQINTNGSFRLDFADYSYCYLQRMTCEPVPTTDLNVHQLAAMLTSMNEQIQDLESRLQITDERLAETISAYGNLLDEFLEQRCTLEELEHNIIADDCDANQRNEETFGWGVNDGWGEDTKEPLRMEDLEEPEIRDIEMGLNLEDGQVDEAGYSAEDYHVDERFIPVRHQYTIAELQNIKANDEAFFAEQIRNFGWTQNLTDQIEAEQIYYARHNMQMDISDEDDDDDSVPDLIDCDGNIVYDMPVQDAHTQRLAEEAYYNF